MSKLEIIYGPMFSGKSTELIEKIRYIINKNKKIIVIKPEIDDRYEKFYVCSHDKEKEECTIINSNDIFSISNKIKYQEADYVIIDEAQFIKNLKNFVLKEKDKKNFIIAGLDLDYLKNPFGEILELKEYADRVLKLQSTCYYCNLKAPFTKRIINNNNKILIGSNDSYCPVCIKHYDEEDSINLNK